MHELAIAGEIITVVQEEMNRRNLRKIESVHMRVGALTGVNTDALAFGFEAGVIDTPLAGVRLVVEHIPVRGVCRSCRQEFEVMEFLFLCPHCGAVDIDVTAGEELHIDHLVCDD